jgi:hypothetical protein
LTGPRSNLKFDLSLSPAHEKHYCYFNVVEYDAAKSVTGAARLWFGDLIALNLQRAAYLLERGYSGRISKYTPFEVCVDVGVGQLEGNLRLCSAISDVKSFPKHNAESGQSILSTGF